MTSLDNQTAFVTGANRGLGQEFVRQLLERGATKVYATARDASKIDTTDPRVVALELDVTDPESVRRAAAAASDVTVLINNAGITTGGALLTDDQSALRQEFETNFFAPLQVTSALADQIIENGNGVVLNVHSALSWISFGGTYEPTKAALWSATNGLRLALAPQGVQVVGLHVGYVDTDMTVGVDAPKSTPEEVVRAALDGVEAGAFEVLADEVSRQVKAGLSAPIEAMYPQLAAQPV
ncbi:MAG: Short-chain dehydrogenase [Aeromicrobium sp.]|nr:Short-chain dehydrogenase [Aeromicrobium sp.]